jgi:ppGpp synthetase/RelA/SpoT-type nucleotidyltranferase
VEGKRIDSFAKKIEQPKYNGNMLIITDLAGIRVIAYVEEDAKNNLLFNSNVVQNGP